jgi:hypothetical protein
VRELHGDQLTPIEVWHGGEAGMDSACAAWTKLFPPLACFHAHGEASVLHKASEDREGGSALALKLGLLGKPTVGATGFHEARDGAQAAADRRRRLDLAASGVGLPRLEWVRGWPIKPLALLLTRYDTVTTTLGSCVSLSA